MSRPKPTALKLVTGNPGKRRLPKNEPKPRRVRPSPPAHLSRDALVAWGAFSERLFPLGLLTELDAAALELLCENYAEIQLLRRDLDANGWFETITRTNGTQATVTRAAAARLSDAERRFRSMLVEFGLTPSARSKVTATPDDDRRDDPAAAYGL